jgi:hypothetical protein
MQTVESKPATGSSTAPPEPTPPPPTVNIERLEKLCAERAALKAERDDGISKVVALQLLRDGEVAPEVRARRDAITQRLKDLDELEVALRPLAEKEVRVKLIAEQLAAFELRKQNQAKAAAVKARIADLATQIAEAEKEYHRWSVTEPDGVMGSSQRLTRHRHNYPQIEEEG